MLLQNKLIVCSLTANNRTRPSEVSTSRRSILTALPIIALPSLWSFGQPSVSHADTKKQLSSEFIAAFNKALSQTDDPAKADRSWTDVIQLDPTNSYAWSNRGTIRLQQVCPSSSSIYIRTRLQGEWKGAKEDLLKAYELETADGKASGILLNNLGNVYGALDDWETAIEKFRAASLEPAMTPIALGNLAFALFQLERTDEAIRQAKALLRKDPNFLDMRAALTGFLWSIGEEGEAESQWSQLQAANDGLGGEIYKKEVAIERVQGRWPPRAVAALDAFLKVSRQGESLDYDQTKKTFSFTLS